jgi:hypothetical protein
MNGRVHADGAAFESLLLADCVEKLRELHLVVTFEPFGKRPRNLRIKWAFRANHPCARSASKYSHPSFSTLSTQLGHSLIYGFIDSAPFPRQQLTRCGVH